jgi:hypothetical protein
MSASRRPKLSREKVRDYRERMKRKGMRLIQLWVPDVRSPEFETTARRQALAVARSPQEEEDIAFVESVADTLDDE